MLLDNLYCNGHVSADGHPWSTMAYNTDYIARNWALTYSQPHGGRRRRRGRPAEGPVGLPLGRLRPRRPDLPQLRRVRPRVSQPDGSFRMEGARARAWSATSAPTTASPRSGKRGARHRQRRDVPQGVPRVREERQPAPVHRHEPGRGPHHGHDARHVHARRPASPATTWRWAGSSRPSRTSKFWPETAIFVIEDDAQNGPDHVDAHRTVGLVDQPLHQAAAPGQHAVQHREHDPDDGADPGPAAA